jgi:hypothetical protein
MGVGVSGPSSVRLRKVTDIVALVALPEPIALMGVTLKT